MWCGSTLGAVFYTFRTLVEVECGIKTKWSFDEAIIQGWHPKTFWWIPSFFYETSFMMMTFYMLCMCVALQIGLTLLLPKRPEEDPQRLYWANPLNALKSAGWPGLGDYRVLSALVVVVMLGLYWTFR
jgi:hypothetical protein